jgi:DNA polymerase V
MQNHSESPLFTFYTYSISESIELPLFVSTASCGFTNVAEDYIQETIDIASYLVPNPVATFLVRARGNSMNRSRIFDNSLLIVDRSVSPTRNSVCLCVVNGEFTVKKIDKRAGKIFLVPTNPSSSEIEITEGMEFEVWGVITKVINEPV